MIVGQCLEQKQGTAADAVLCFYTGIIRIPLFWPNIGKTGEYFERSAHLFPSKVFETAK